MTVPQRTITKKELELLYFQNGKSVHEIAEKYKCSDNRINYWFKKFNIKKRSISDAIYLKQNPDGDPFNFRKPISKEDLKLFGIGVGLYWGEGTKSSPTSVRLGNTDPKLIKCFIDFLERFYEVPRKKFRFGLQVFSDMSPQKVLDFWVKEIGFSKDHFGKVIVTPSRGRGTYRKKIQHGVLTVYVSNKKLRDLICMEIEKMS